MKSPNHPKGEKKHKTILLAGYKESYAFEVPSEMFKGVVFSLTTFCRLYRKPSMERKLDLMKGLGFKGKKVKLGQNNSKIVFAYLDEIGKERP